MYGLFCVSFLYHASSPVAFTFETAIVNELVYGSDFANAVYSRESWAVWLRDAFVPLVLGLGDGTAGEDAQVIGGYALPLGGIRVRQTRQAARACPDATAARVYAGTCYAGAASGAVGDAAAAAPFGTPPDAFAPSGLPGDPVLSYQLLLSTVSDLATAQAVVDGLVAGAWTDAGTRVLSVQLALLNAQPGVDRWGVVSFDASFEPGGLVRATTTVRSFPDAPYPASAPGSAAGAGFVLFIDALLVVYALYVLAGTLRRVATRVARARGCGGKAAAALLDAWLVIDYFTTYFLWALIANWADFARQLAAVRAGIDGDGAASPATYASGDRKGFLVALLNAGATFAYARIMAAWALIFLAIRQFKYLQYQSRLAVMTQSIAMSVSDSAAFSLLLAIVLSMYGVWGVAMFGSQAADWQDSHVAVTSIFRYMMYDYDLVAMEAVNVDMARLFFASYMLLVTNLILWMFLAIFLESYTDVRAASHKGNTVGEDAAEAAAALALRLATCPPWRRGGCCSLVPHGIAEAEAFLTALAADAGGAPRVTLGDMLAAARTAELAAPGPAPRPGGAPGGLPPPVVRALFAEALSLEAAAEAGITLPGLGGASGEEGEGDHATHVSRPPPPGAGSGEDPAAAPAGAARPGGGGAERGRSALALRTVMLERSASARAAAAAAAAAADDAGAGARLSGGLPPAGYGSI